MATEETFDSCATPTKSALAAVASNEATELEELAKIGYSSRQLIKVIQRLDALNMNTTLKSLPKFVVVSNKSASKSSIIKAAYKIALPRSQGTCIRCPSQITTSASSDDTLWQCRASLHYRYTYDSYSRVPKDSLYPGWTEQDLDI